MDGRARSAAAIAAASVVLATALAAAPPSGTARWVDAGIAVTMAVEPVSGEAGAAVVLAAATAAPPAAALREGERVRFRFAIDDAASGLPLGGLYPGAWVAARPPGGADAATGCRERIAEVIGGGLLARPALDLNAYAIVVMNDAPSLSVLDPYASFGGTRLLAMVPLAAPAEDWVLSEDGATLYVAMPRAGRVAVVDTAAWRVTAELAVPPAPARLALERGGRRLWVVHDDAAGAPGPTVVVVPEGTATVVPTGRGPHRLALDPDGGRAWVTNRGDGTVAVVDTRARKVLRTHHAGSSPVAVDFAAATRTAWVASEEDGAVTVVDARSDEIVARLAAEPGARELRFAPRGRLGFLLNPRRDLLQIVDAEARRVVQSGGVEHEPDQVAFSDTIAYLRHRGSDVVLMLPLERLGVAGERLPIGEFPGGRAAFGAAGVAGAAAAGMVRAPGMNAMLVAHPADQSIYVYKEGMAAPMGELSTRPHAPRAVLAVDRSLREREAGVYETAATLPRAGLYDVLFFVDSPRMVHCEELRVAPRADAPAAARRVVARIVGESGGRLEAGRRTTLRLRLSVEDGAAIDGAADVELQLQATGANWSTTVPAQSAGDGVYSAAVEVPAPGVYYLLVTSASHGLRAGDVPRLALAAAAAPRVAGRTGAAQQ